ncbi:hypothetical protein TKK_0004481 [Trichogramma kaykai]|uniref:THAP-type domain-containing protein n=1 Tax=Trichogramma kaykai TaxID=54128 RepID=A0ABD2XM97_9HYME
MSKKGGYYCAFKNCRGLSRRDKRSFFRFPKDPERSKQWVRACNRNDLLEKTPIELFNSYRVCAKHFTDSMFLNDLRNRLQPNSVPTHFSQQQPDQIQQVGNNNETTNSQQQQQQQQPIVVAGTTAATTQLVTCTTATANNDFDIVDEAQIQLADCSHDSVAKILSNCVFQKISADEFFKATGICIKEPSSSSEPTNHNIRATTNDDSTTAVEDYLRSSSGNGDCSLSTADHVYSSTTTAANCSEPQLTNAVDSSSSCYGIKDILVDPSSSSFSIEGLSYQDLMGCSSLQPLSSLIAPIEICGNDDDDDDLRSFSMSRVVGLDDVDRLPDTILEGQEDDEEAEDRDEDSSSELSNSLESFQPSSSSLQTSVVVDDVVDVVAAACLEAASTASSSSSSNASQGNKSTGEACTQTNAYHLLPSDNNKLDKVSQTENDDDNDKKEPSSPSFHEQTSSRSGRGSGIVSRDRANKRKLKRILQVKRCEIKSLKSKLLKQNLVELMEHVTLEQYKSLTERFFPKETSDFIKTQAQLFDQEKISQDKQYSLEFKKQCLALFLTGPRTYKNLQKIFCLPAVHDLQTLKF